MKTPRVVVQYCAEYQQEIEQLSFVYGMPIVRDMISPHLKYCLRYQNQSLKLFDLKQPKFRPIYVDVRQRSRLGKNSLLAKAMGKRTKTIVDATAGFGRDAFLLARMGFEVIAVERVPAIAALLEDGIIRANKFVDYLQVKHLHVDAIVHLAKLTIPPDTIYVDPMYPIGRKKSAKTARPNEVLRELAGDDNDALKLLEAALNSKAKRVVVKRPHYAKPLNADRRTAYLIGKMVRYDIYVPTTNFGLNK